MEIGHRKRKSWWVMRKGREVEARWKKEERGEKRERKQWKEDKREGGRGGLESTRVFPKLASYSNDSPRLGLQTMCLWSTHVHIVSLLYSPKPSQSFFVCLSVPSPRLCLPHHTFASCYRTTGFSSSLWLMCCNIFPPNSSFLVVFSALSFGESKLYVYCIHSLSVWVCFQMPPWQSNPWCIVVHCKSWTLHGHPVYVTITVFVYCYGDECDALANATYHSIHSLS